MKERRLIIISFLLTLSTLYYINGFAQKTYLLTRLVKNPAGQSQRPYITIPKVITADEWIFKEVPAVSGTSKKEPADKYDQDTFMPVPDLVMEADVTRVVPIQEPFHQVRIPVLIRAEKTYFQPASTYKLNLGDDPSKNQMWEELYGLPSQNPTIHVRRKVYRPTKSVLFKGQSWRMPVLTRFKRTGRIVPNHQG